MKRTLYLVENRNKITVHADGPSLLVTSEGRASRRIPLKFIDKIIVIGSIRINTNAIHLCAENKIPVLFTAKDYTDKAILLPYNHTLPNHYKEQRIMLQSTETVRRYKKWIYTRVELYRLDILKSLFKGFSFPSELGEGNYQFIINKFKENKPYWDTVKDIVMNFIKAILAGRLIQAGLDLHLGIIHRRVNFGLLLDLSLIFDAEADFQSIKFYRSCKNISELERLIKDGELTEAGIKNIIDRFESRRLYITETVESLIDEVFEIMKDIRK